MFFSVYIKPGYNLSALEEFGFISVWDLFKGQTSEASEANVSIEGTISIQKIGINLGGEMASNQKVEENSPPLKFNPLISQ